MGDHLSAKGAVLRLERDSAAGLLTLNRTLDLPAREALFDPKLSYARSDSVPDT